MQEPPGGPPDFEPPVILAVTPDSGTVVDSLREPLLLEYNEVISEASGGGLDRLVRVSPRPEAVEVDWKRTRVAIRPKGGWKPGVVYHVRVLPGVTDLRNNRLDSARTVIFSTGGPIPDTRITGTVLDWENGRVGTGALIEAYLLPDSLVYTGAADSTGAFQLRAVPRGAYLLFTSMDENRNGRRDVREPFDSVTLSLDSAATHTAWAFIRDTLGPQLRQVSSVDSITVLLQFSQKLDPAEAPERGVVVAWQLPDTVEMQVASIFTEQAYEAVKAAEDSARRAAADTLPADTTAPPAPTPPRPPEPAQPALAPAAAADTAAAAAPDTSAAAALLRQRPTLSARWYVRLGQPLAPGGRYLFQARARNLSGAVAESRNLLVMPAPRDST
jgi:hypothetical protein